jgi:hypothetical protein
MINLTGMEPGQFSKIALEKQAAVGLAAKGLGLVGSAAKRILMPFGTKATSRVGKAAQNVGNIAGGTATLGMASGAYGAVKGAKGAVPRAGQAYNYGRRNLRSIL